VLKPVANAIDKSLARSLRAALSAGVECDDASFDAFIPVHERAVSVEYWTPLRVAARAAEWFSQFGARLVVDVGSGVGKFCVAAALCGRFECIGLEHRPRFVAAARRLAEVFEVADRVRFVQSSDSPWPPADAYYLYNPFAENVCAREDQLDTSVELTPARYQREIARAEQFFARAPAGTLVVTYNGFGGRVPDSYRQVAVDRDQAYELCMWQKE
jgi:predicted RNA methylase